MRVAGTREFAAPREAVWEVLNDPARMAQTMPGVESFDVQDDRHWTANVSVPLGLGALRLSINFEKTEERAPEHARLHAKGTGVGALLSMDTSFELSEQQGQTAMRWEADVRVAGPVGSMGQRVLQPIVNQQVEQVLGALEQQVGAAGASGRRESAGRETPPSESGGAGTAGSPPPTTEGVSPRTDPELKDYGEPAETTPDADPSESEGTSGAEEGLSPWDEEAYSPEPEKPERVTDEPPGEPR